MQSEGPDPCAGDLANKAVCQTRSNAFEIVNYTRFRKDSEGDWPLAREAGKITNESRFAKRMLVIISRCLKKCLIRKGSKTLIKLENKTTG